MRLSEKGCVHLNEWMVHKLPMDGFEFKPEDFTGCVVLTAEEAEKLMELLDNCEYWLTDNDISYDCDSWASLLEERIDHAEEKK